MFDPGDGTVTKPSLLARDTLNPLTPRHAFSYFPLGFAFLLCEDHSTLTGNAHFQNNLLEVLLTRARPWELHVPRTGVACWSSRPRSRSGCGAASARGPRR